MPTCRDISPEVWEHARQVLVFYFARRFRTSQAEDLAQDTLAALLSREDYEFEKAEDFLKICYAFASRVLKQDFRQEKRRASETLPEESDFPRAKRAAWEVAETKVLLEEVLRIGRTQMDREEWKLILDATEHTPSSMEGVTNAGIANRVRVRLFRARKKLAELTGWKPGKR